MLATVASPRTRIRWQRLVAAARFALAIGCAVALVFRYLWGIGWVEPLNFVAYLTIQSNIAFVLVSAVSAVFALRGWPTKHLDRVRAGVLTCTVTAGIVFAAILQQSLARGVTVYLPPSDVVLHFVLPVIAIADWVLTPRTRPSVRVLVFVLGYVGTWGVITLFRGAATGWYPYYFLDPGQTDGPGELILLSAIAVAVFVVVGLAVILAPRPVRWWAALRRGRGFGGRPREERRRSGRREPRHPHRPQHPAAPDAR
ncbi:hypothetical protein M2152_002284 [Microbacteriaceae bacterium SG_E_30_P1]|uniref:FAR-17a/AIG1-like protein n=1 Tax=Antiquaquibacter oligotrophicus TaxID=2880260 RepID=A0ABT6KSE0_9MICO|nr:hypothetical protein [Antiquaquibacter oligotrophicus]